jgi:sec-independent protein translocase protein TatA
MELAVVLIIALIFVGPKKLPGLGRSIGGGLREFKDTLSGTDPRTHVSEVMSDIRSEVDPRVVDEKTPAGEPEPQSSSGTAATD